MRAWVSGRNPSWRRAIGNQNGGFSGRTRTESTSPSHFYNLSFCENQENAGRNRVAAVGHLVGRVH
jgi:hypothetical protein